MRVFVSYRRSDSRQAAGRLRDHLADAFGDDNVFFDVDSIDFGVDFREVIRETIRQSDAVIVVIGPNFDVSRLAQDNDFMRLEVVEAMAQNKRLVPVLVEDARMPLAAELPGLEALAYHHAAPVRSDPDFRRDAARLIESLQRAANIGAAVGARQGAPRAPDADPAAEIAVPAAPSPVGAAEPSDIGPAPAPVRPEPSTINGPIGTRPEARLRWAARLAAAGSFALLVARAPAFFSYDWGTSRLHEVGGVSKGVLLLALLAACAAVSMFTNRNGQGTGVTMLAAMLPAVSALALTFFAVLYYETRNDEMRGIAAGFVLVELGCALILASAVIAATRVRRYLTMASGATRAEAAPMAAAAVLGFITAVVWGREFNDGGLWSGGHVLSLVVVLAILGLVRCVLWEWLSLHGVVGTLGAVVTAFAYGALLLEHLLSVGTTDGGDLLVRSVLFVIIISATVVPLMGVLLRPRRRAALFVVVWALAIFAADPDSGTANLLLPLALAAIAGVAIFNASRTPDDSDDPIGSQRLEAA